MSNQELSPIVVDLDGSFVLTDTLIESTFKLFKANPWTVVSIPLWLLKGKAGFKDEIAQRIDLNPEELPLNEPLYNWLMAKKKLGHTIVLATAANHRIANSIAKKFSELFSDVFSSTATNNLGGTNKLRELKLNFKNFIYVGNAKVDLKVWRESQAAVVVGSEKLKSSAAKLTKVEEYFPPKMRRLRAIRKSLRPHQWAKNLLLFLPLILAHQVNNPTAIQDVLWGFLCFSMIASSVYLINDLSDIESDRKHPDKKNRPIPSGNLPLPTAIVMTVVLMALSFGISLYISPILCALLICYSCISNLYSFTLKKVPIIDCFTLAGLYTFRIFVGGVISGISLTYWLISFSMFFFLSLAFAKRVTELKMLLSQNKSKNSARGYYVGDMPLLRTLGVATGVGSILIFSLYIHHPGVVILYKSSILLIGVAIALLYWISRVWLLVERDKMHSDPIVFAIKDRVSYVVLIVCLGFIVTSKYVDFGLEELASGGKILLPQLKNFF